MEAKELRKRLENFTLEEIASKYEEFNPDLFDERFYDIPKTMEEWEELISYEINENGHSFEDIFEGAY